MGKRNGKWTGCLLILLITLPLLVLQEGSRAEVDTGEEAGLFINITPENCTYLLDEEISLRMKVNVSIGNMNEFDFFYAFQTNGSLFSNPIWEPVTQYEANGTHIDLLVNLSLRNGTANWIIFFENSTGPNGTTSPAHNLWYDGQVPFVEFRFPKVEDWLLDPLHTLRFYAHDTLSGIDRDKVEYRITTQGLNKWTPWRSYTGNWSSDGTEISITERFRRGEQNFVQLRCWDMVGNGPTTSDSINIKINTYPVIDVISPGAGDELYADEDIVFDASPSHDPDGDRLTISWYISTIDGQDLLGDTPLVIARLESGEYTITVIAKDRVNNEVQYHFTITVMPPPSVPPPWVDSDLDGLPDYWEYLWQTDPYFNDAHEDPDGDGYTNLQEYENCTNPKNRPGPPPDDEDEPDNDINIAYLLLIFLAVVVLIMISLSLIVYQKNRTQREMVQEE
ncbi:MAG: REJ domain-containing protein [Candidatus Thermoplasmatota archaeon]|nr:REJ domain-containing protein [Candidatus Thermoplasmatota archaeon]